MGAALDSANGNSGIRLYVLAVDDAGYLAEQAKAVLGKANVGKSCIRFRRLADSNLSALAKLITQATRMSGPGEVSSGTAKKNAVAKKPAAKRILPLRAHRRAPRDAGLFHVRGSAPSMCDGHAIHRRFSSATWL